MKELFQKWGMVAQYVKRFTYDEIFLRGHARGFLIQLFNSAAVRAELTLCSKQGQMVAISKNAHVTDIRFTPLACSATSLDMFDSLKTKYPNEILREDSTQVVRIPDLYLNAGVTVGDRLRETLMMGDDATYSDVFTAGEKSEFLYHVLWRIAAGGAICQYEDDAEVYFHTARDLYKDVVNVRRSSDGSNGVETATDVFMVTDVTGIDLFGRRDDNGNHNFCYVCVSPAKREVILWYNGFVSMF